MQHHFDEFSVTDMRHTLLEIWRVVLERRWLFIWPFCTVTTLALVCSLWLPRTYTATTVIRREHDPVLANLVSKTWIQPYEQIREEMANALANADGIKDVLDDLDLPEKLARFPDGTLTPDARARRKAHAEQIANGISVRVIEQSKTHDVVAIELRQPSPDHLKDILRGLRERYIAGARARTVTMLRDVEQFLLSQADRTGLALSEIQRKLATLQMQYPGIDPNAPDPHMQERSDLATERAQVEHALASLSQQAAQFEAILKRPTDQNGEIVGQRELQVKKPNPRYSELVAEIESIRGEMAKKRTERMMTDEHPAMVRLQSQLQERMAELSDTPKTISGWSAEETDANGLTARDRLEMELAQIERDLGMHGDRLKQIEQRQIELLQQQALAVEHRQEFLRLKRAANDKDIELASWRENIGPIQKLTTAEAEDRTVHFETVTEAAAVGRPSWPDARFVLLVCLGLGAAVGGLAMLIGELADGSFRTVKRLSSSLGVPVIEEIDEIVTGSMRRRRLVRNLLVIPVTTGILVAAMIITGTMAYFSIENPKEYERAKASPQRTWRMFTSRI